MAVARVLFVDTHNSARSQMAESMLRAQARGEVEAFSAGLEPRDLRPETLTVLGEVGIDTSQLRSKGLDEFDGQRFDWVVLIGDERGENRPLIEGASATAVWNIEDPWQLRAARRSGWPPSGASGSTSASACQSSKSSLVAGTCPPARR